MNTKICSILAGASLVVLSGCSSLYKSGQTPDDVYFSPGKAAAGYASGNEDGSDYLETNTRRRYNDRYSDPNYSDDQYMRMAIATGRRPVFYDDFAMMNPYYRNSWMYNSFMVWNSPFYSPWNSMYMWNSFYNPYWGMGNGWYGGGFGFGWSPGWGTGWGNSWAGGNYYNKPGNFYTMPRPSRPQSAFTMGSYLNTNSNRNSYRVNEAYRGNYNNRNSYNGRNNNSSMYNNQSNSTNRSSNSSSAERPTRSYTPSSSSGSSRSSSGGGGGVSRPPRTGN